MGVVHFCYVFDWHKGVRVFFLGGGGASRVEIFKGAHFRGCEPIRYANIGRIYWKSGGEGHFCLSLNLPMQTPKHRKFYSTSRSYGGS